MFCSGRIRTALGVESDAAGILLGPPRERASRSGTAGLLEQPGGDRNDWSEICQAPAANLGLERNYQNTLRIDQRGAAVEPVAQTHDMPGGANGTERGRGSDDREANEQ